MQARNTLSCSQESFLKCGVVGCFYLCLYFLNVQFSECDFLKTALWRYNSHIITKYTIQWFLAYAQSCAIITTT